MSILIIKPDHCGDAYIEAANVFQSMYEKVTGKMLSIADCDDGVSDLVVIGSDAVNKWVLDRMFEGDIPARLGLTYGTDSYCIKSFCFEGRNVLVLAGGRGRSTLYAVYDYFERYADCHYFWDGDIIGHKEALPITDIDIVEKPRFEYRGLRYFAHRGLKRFQAEHWSMEDWKQEIDWMVKRRLNFFMLRIGMDDIWQRAFPDIVKYPKEFNKIDGYNTYDDRSDFWTLKYRGELREKVLEYARRLDLDYPTDCGTMTHWYSRTPKEFLEQVNPTLITDNHYGQADTTGMIMDYLNPENMDIYMKLTEIMVETHEKRNDLFHSIGLGERNLFPQDTEKDFNMKLFAYRLISENLRKRYPNSKLMLASWDFVGWWEPENVARLMEELDPERTIILDYTSDQSSPEQSFLNWGMVNNFPYIFGIFHAYEPESDLRGCYKRTDERLKVAADDPYCKGLIFWPELSHSDPLILEYLTVNAWNPLNKNIEKITEDFCHNRYPDKESEMNECWQLMLPIINTKDWGGYNSKITPDDPDYAEKCPLWEDHKVLWVSPAKEFAEFKKWERELRIYYTDKEKEILPTVPDAIKAIRKLAVINDFENNFFSRDAVDIARTVISRILEILLAKAFTESDNTELVAKIKVHYLEIMKVFAKVLSLNDDFLILKTLEDLKKTAPVNPDFEITLKRNICCPYCEQAAYELIVGRYIGESTDVFDWLLAGKKNGEALPQEQFYRDKFIATPLADIQPAEKYNPKETFMEAADCIERALLIF